VSRSRARSAGSCARRSPRHEPRQETGRLRPNRQRRRPPGRRRCSACWISSIKGKSFMGFGAGGPGEACAASRRTGPERRSWPGPSWEGVPGTLLAARGGEPGVLPHVRLARHSQDRPAHEAAFTPAGHAEAHEPANPTPSTGRRLGAGCRQEGRPIGPARPSAPPRREEPSCSRHDGREGTHRDPIGERVAGLARIEHGELLEPQVVQRHAH